MVAFGTALRADDERDLPPLDGLVQIGCRTEPIDVLDTTTRKRHYVFRLTVWAEHRNADGNVERDWNFFYSERKSKKETRKDCVEWQERVDAAIEKAQKKK